MGTAGQKVNKPVMTTDGCPEHNLRGCVSVHLNVYATQVHVYLCRKFTIYEQSHKLHVYYYEFNKIHVS